MINVDFRSYSGYTQTVLSMPVILHRLTLSSIGDFSLLNFDH